MNVVALLALLPAALLALPTAVVVVQAVVGLAPRRLRPAPSRTPGCRLAALIPAHDEEQGIAATLANLQRQLAPGDRILVVADNCSDQTASVARAAGAEVVERQDPMRRGKGYALSFGLDHLANDPPQIVIVVDADCELSDGSLAHLCERAFGTGRPVQADYTMTPPIGAATRTRVSAFAFRVRNRVRPEGLARLGLPCQLTGSGMALPWTLARSAAPLRDQLVEDMAMGLDLACQGHPPLRCGDALVTSELPTGAAAQAAQRRRWEHGQLALLPRFVPKLIAGSIKRLNPGLFALALDLAVPPLALHVLLLGVLTTVGALASFATHDASAALAAGSQLALLSGVLAAVWLVHGRDLLSVRDVLGIPGYVLWKIPSYVKLALSGKEATWVRTARDEKSSITRTDTER
jgi:cellulose synthase/poly-beta-1,6-N-acetylglucosamine synthase-like glycosyltransferase